MVGAVGIEPGHPSGSQLFAAKEAELGTRLPDSLATTWDYRNPIVAFCRLDDPASTYLARNHISGTWDTNLQPRVGRNFFIRELLAIARRRRQCRQTNPR